MNKDRLHELEKIYKQPASKDWAGRPVPKIEEATHRRDATPAEIQRHLEELRKK
jgi:hypothetical protein